MLAFRHRRRDEAGVSREGRETPRAWVNPAFAGSAGASVARNFALGHDLRRKAAAGLALGTFVIELPHSTTLRSLALAGFDFAVLDLEHSSLGLDGLESLIAAGHAAGLPLLVRPWSVEDGLIGKILDMGANGIMAPRVENVDRARTIVEQVRFGAGRGRGFAPLTRYDALEMPLEALNAATLLVLQIEGREGIEHAPAIAQIPGVDALFVGPYDLALSLGVPPGSPRVGVAAARFARAMPRGRVLGIYVDDPKRSAQWAARGFSLQCVSFDGRMFANGARAIVAAARRSKRTATGGRR
jgi:4-hydroxy-2-oxoheptanedioate aldolase